MEPLQAVIKKFCIDNVGGKKINFQIFKTPEKVYRQFGNKRTYNQFKGEMLELLLEELFLGNGYRVERLGEDGKDGGCDLLIKYPDNSIRFILQAKNWNKNIDKYEVIREHAKFSDNYQKQYELNPTHFCFVS